MQVDADCAKRPDALVGGPGARGTRDLPVGYGYLRGGAMGDGYVGGTGQRFPPSTRLRAEAAVHVVVVPVPGRPVASSVTVDPSSRLQVGCDQALGDQTGDERVDGLVQDVDGSLLARPRARRCAYAGCVLERLVGRQAKDGVGGVCLRSAQPDCGPHSPESAEGRARALVHEVIPHDGLVMFAGATPEKGQ